MICFPVYNIIDLAWIFWAWSELTVRNTISAETVWTSSCDREVSFMSDFVMDRRPSILVWIQLMYIRRWRNRPKVKCFVDPDTVTVMKCTIFYHELRKLFHEVEIRSARSPEAPLPKTGKAFFQNWENSLPEAEKESFKWFESWENILQKQINNSYVIVVAEVDVLKNLCLWK